VRLWQTRDDRVDAGLNATLDKDLKTLRTIFVPEPTTPGIKVITKLLSAQGASSHCCLYA
jgi:hypothetical protein